MAAIDMVDNIRLSARDIECIREIFRKHFGAGDALWIFGSRVNMAARGGDIDLYIETNLPVPGLYRRKIDFLVDLKQRIGDQKIDVVINAGGREELIYTIARTKGVRLV